MRLNKHDVEKSDKPPEGARRLRYRQDQREHVGSINIGELRIDVPSDIEQPHMASSFEKHCFGQVFLFPIRCLFWNPEYNRIKLYWRILA